MGMVGGVVPSVDDVSRGAPTMKDALRAADALWHLDPGLVPLYGSVADGTADADSDLDLVVVFDDLGDYSQRPLLRRRARRMRRVCASAQAAMETGLKALNHALPGPHPPRTHDLAALIDVLSVAAGERDRLAAAVEGLDLEEAALWREMGTYPGDFEAEVVAGRSTSEHAAKMVNAAVPTDARSGRPRRRPHRRVGRKPRGPRPSWTGWRARVPHGDRSPRPR